MKRNGNSLLEQLVHCDDEAALPLLCFLFHLRECHCAADKRVLDMLRGRPERHMPHAPACRALTHRACCVYWTASCCVLRCLSTLTRRL